MEPRIVQLTPKRLAVKKQMRVLSHSFGKYRVYNFDVLSCMARGDVFVRYNTADADLSTVTRNDKIYLFFSRHYYDTHTHTHNIGYVS